MSSPGNSNHRPAPEGSAGEADAFLLTLQALVRFLREERERLARCGVEADGMLEQLARCEVELTRSQSARAAALEFCLQTVADEADAEHRGFQELRRLISRSGVDASGGEGAKELLALVERLGQLFPRED